MGDISVRLPDIGEGVTQAELVEWHVALGAFVREDDPLASVMTDKATVEIPSLHSGEVVWLAGAVGDVLAIGSDLVRIRPEKGVGGPASGAAAIAQSPVEPMEQPERLPSTEAGPILPVRLPDVGEGVTEAELVEWHVKVGDDVQEDQLLAAVMTDKATVEIPSLYAGKVVQLGGDIGAVLAVGANLVLIETKTAAAPQGIEMPKPPPSKAPSPAAPPPVPLSAADDAGRPLPARASIAQSGAPRSEGSPVLASPSVRARARENGIDLRQVAGSGPAGRITHDDLDGIFAAPAGAGVTRTSSSRGPRTASTQIKVVGMRRKIAERMALANSRIPHITVIEEVDVTALEELRERLNAGRGDKPKLTLLPFVTAALSRAFVDHPEMNAHFDDEAGVVTRHGPVHLGIATMTDAGLVVPVLRHAEALRLWESAAEIARLSSVARAGKANRDELSGSTFTITSLGPLGAIATTPIINHPEVAILGINKMAVRPMWDGSQFQPRKMMNISASFDHRVIDGWDAAVFVQKMKSLLETPTLIFLDQNA